MKLILLLTLLGACKPQVCVEKPFEMKTVWLTASHERPSKKLPKQGLCAYWIEANDNILDRFMTVIREQYWEKLNFYKVDASYRDSIHEIMIIYYAKDIKNCPQTVTF